MALFSQAKGYGFLSQQALIILARLLNKEGIFFLWVQKCLRSLFVCEQVSETENIRKNLAIERMIVEGCDILLDVNQIFVRQGTLVQIMAPGKDGQRRP